MVGKSSVNTENDQITSTCAICSAPHITQSWLTSPVSHVVSQLSVCQGKTGPPECTWMYDKGQKQTRAKGPWVTISTNTCLNSSVIIYSHYIILSKLNMYASA